MPSRDEAKDWVLRIHGLFGGPELARKAAARLIARLGPIDATELLQHLLVLAREGWGPATCVLSTFMAALRLEGAIIPNASALRRVAALQELELTAALFPEAPAREEMDPGAAAKADARLFNESLGHLKTKARNSRNHDEIAKLVQISHPAVVRSLLCNVRLTESQVLRIASRRPTRPEPLLEVWASPRWSVRHLVRRALAFNPYLPPAVAAKVVPLLNAIDLKELSRDPAVHQAVRTQASLLLRSLERKIVEASGPSGASP